jgi:hypothetical protein
MPLCRVAVKEFSLEKIHKHAFMNILCRNKFINMRIVLVFLFSSFPIFTFSQTMKSIMDTSNQWFVLYPYGNRPGGYVAVLEFHGDTIVANKKYNKLIKRKTSENAQEYLGCLRCEINGDIKFCPPYENKEYLLYPDSLSVSMNINVFTRSFRDQGHGNEMTQLLTVDTTMIINSEGNIFQSFILHRKCKSKGIQTWIVGIGSKNGPLGNYISEHCIENGLVIEISGLSKPRLIAFKKENEILFFDVNYYNYYESVKTTIK